MFPVLVWMYVRLARHEEREAFAAFGEAYAQYTSQVPAFVPRLSRLVERST
jgi:protein-S-isoprenylcysteine O-methyltransferase Ste14